ncbi:MAG: cell division ATPase MinD [Hadesarchaea archaeon]|nr:cell division ATPase MinD [Hadesarchaea archaeon]
MSRIINFASGKGGTGKTTVTANVAVAASQMGKNICVLDADVPMANLSLVYGFDDLDITLHEILAGENDLDEAIYSGPGGVKAVPSGMSLNGVRKANLQNLKSVVEELSEEFEIILIDCPSGLGEEAVSALQIADELVLVTMPEITCLSDALKTKIVSERFGADVLGVVISRAMEEDLDVPEEEVKEMLELPVLGTIPEDPEIRESTTYGEPVVLRKPDSPSGKALIELASNLFEEK